VRALVRFRSALGRSVEIPLCRCRTRPLRFTVTRRIILRPHGCPRMYGPPFPESNADLRSSARRSPGRGVRCPISGLGVHEPDAGMGIDATGKAAEIFIDLRHGSRAFPPALAIALTVFGVTCSRCQLRDVPGSETARAVKAFWWWRKIGSGFRPTSSRPQHPGIHPNPLENARDGCCDKSSLSEELNRWAPFASSPPMPILDLARVGQTPACVPLSSYCIEPLAAPISLRLFGLGPNSRNQPDCPCPPAPAPLTPRDWDVPNRRNLVGVEDAQALFPPVPRRATTRCTKPSPNPSPEESTFMPIFFSASAVTSPKVTDHSGSRSWLMITNLLAGIARVLQPSAWQPARIAGHQLRPLIPPWYTACRTHKTATFRAKSVRIVAISSLACSSSCFTAGEPTARRNAAQSFLNGGLQND